MKLFLELKTNRTQTGKAKATLTRFYNYSRNRIAYGFRFYNDYKFFDHHAELRQYIMDNYNGVDIGTRKDFWGL